mmetsp:Transcript_1463/g.2497  ORF Transcript_1463/g.2497 Transcript_1463/m.2497 type:complete len:115 (-) Transcript_1463:52-396(-)|eukprot:CAMPEP_0201628688 /NCGR_PEP_ID=MMETSP0493-20130528/3575_1 /ASSEMBLY_ACC=CAM_ASM_000838 /TAXON_ID=420259 /ORGANISM="Thalassiosira gravida, Strain GMp14c1" /LENGTH=114 /DNA_ID=CAMNT_0048099513 /DNA_START=51 /DNA_END=395 /DNA_ORIENTATION=-
MKNFLLCSLLLVSLSTYGAAFVQPTTVSKFNNSARSKKEAELFVPSRQQFPTALGLIGGDDREKDVNVNLLPDVDAFTLTAIGFGLIAFNFFVLANMGDAGLAGVVARIINTFS